MMIELRWWIGCIWTVGADAAIILECFIFIICGCRSLITMIIQINGPCWALWMIVLMAPTVIHLIFWLIYNNQFILWSKLYFILFYFSYCKVIFFCCMRNFLCDTQFVILLKMIFSYNNKNNDTKHQMVNVCFMWLWTCGAKTCENITSTIKKKKMKKKIMIVNCKHLK